MTQYTNEELLRIIRPLATARYEVDYDWSRVEDMLEWLAEGSGQPVELCPDFQRGHVWTEKQQTAFIENVLREVVSAAGLTLHFNAPAWEDEPSGDLPPTVQCIDGLQRLTAVRRYIAGEVSPFGLSRSDMDGTRFSTRMTRFRFRIAVHTFQTRTDLLQHYLDINAGGTPHSESELDRVRGLMSGPVR